RCREAQPDEIGIVAVVGHDLRPRADRECFAESDENLLAPTLNVVATTRRRVDQRVLASTFQGDLTTLLVDRACELRNSIGNGGRGLLEVCESDLAAARSFRLWGRAESLGELWIYLGEPDHVVVGHWKDVELDTHDGTLTDA